MQVNCQHYDTAEPLKRTGVIFQHNITIYIQYISDGLVGILYYNFGSQEMAYKKEVQNIFISFRFVLKSMF